MRLVFPRCSRVGSHGISADEGLIASLSLRTIGGRTPSLSSRYPSRRMVPWFPYANANCTSLSALRESFPISSRIQPYARGSPLKRDQSYTASISVRSLDEYTSNRPSRVSTESVAPKRLSLTLMSERRTLPIRRVPEKWLLYAYRHNRDLIVESIPIESVWPTNLIPPACIFRERLESKGLAGTPLAAERQPFRDEIEPFLHPSDQTGASEPAQEFVCLLPRNPQRRTDITCPDRRPLAQLDPCEKLRLQLAEVPFHKCVSSFAIFVL